MADITCTVRRIGDYESRTEEYDIAYSVGQGASHGLRIKYQAARAFEINAALDASAEVAREAIAEQDPDLKGPRDEALFKFTWRAIQSAKYEEGESVSASLEY